MRVARFMKVMRVMRVMRVIRVIPVKTSIRVPVLFLSTHM